MKHFLIGIWEKIFSHCYISLDLGFILSLIGANASVEMYYSKLPNHEFNSYLLAGFSALLLILTFALAIKMDKEGK